MFIKFFLIARAFKLEVNKPNNLYFETKRVIIAGSNNVTIEYNAVCIVVVGPQSFFEREHGPRGYVRVLGELHAAPDPQKQLHSIFFLANTPAPKTPDPPNPWI
jgi:hypothetical protein